MTDINHHEDHECVIKHCEKCWDDSLSSILSECFVEPCVESLTLFLLDSPEKGKRGTES